MSVTRLQIPPKRPDVSEEEFLAWQDDPVTRWILSACRKAADENKSAWVNVSWEHGKSDPIALIELRTRADAYMALAETTYEGWLKTHGEEE